jgi:pilus assembly protein Flp/PilA
VIRRAAVTHISGDYHDATAHPLPLTTARQQCIARDTTRGRSEMHVMTSVRRLVNDDSGQDLLEYALLVGLIALVAVLAVTSTGNSINKIFNTISQSLANVT